MICGVLNVDKPTGITSHDCVNRVRRSLGIRRVGHTGTLDPGATGVLLMCVGKATRIAEYLVDTAKEYRGFMVLGIRTDTYDSEGEVIEEREVSGVDLDGIDRLMADLCGALDQVPPPYSAVRYRGRRLYESAREGTPVEAPPRKVRVYDFRVDREGAPETRLFKGSRVPFRVRCSRGTYVRSLCDDLGKALGCGAHLTDLVRTCVGAFRLEESHSLDDVERAAEEGRARRIMTGMNEALRFLPSFDMNEEQLERVRHGGSVRVRQNEEYGEGIAVRLVFRGELVAVGLARADSDHTVLRPQKVLVGSE